MNKNEKSATLDEAELLWIEAEALKPLTELAKRSRPFAIVLVVLLLTMMYPYVEKSLWMIWVILHGLSLLIRSLYISYLKRAHVEKSVNYHFNNLLIIGSIALIWGSTAYPLLIEGQSIMRIMVLNIILVYGIAATIHLSLHLKTLYIFLTCYGIGLMGSVLVIMVFSPLKNHAIDSLVVLIFLLLFLFILNKIGIEINKSHIETLRLQYNNKKLIDSLTVEKQAAINAIEIKNRFLACATHDMRQPILALDLYTDMVLKAPETVPLVVPKIAEATKSVISMFDALFDLARISMNQLQPVKVRFNLEDIISGLEHQYQGVAKEKKLELRVYYKNTNRELLDDPILLRRIIGNLLSNAIKYTETGGVLLVCRDCEKHGCRVEVWDTGLGISPAMQKAVFSEFYKNPENSGTSDGFGLGLSIVSQLCVLLGHKLTMKSRRGHGTVVSIRLANTAVLPIVST